MKRPICVGTNAKGELQWSNVHMELWQILQMYRRQYIGDFGEQWMYLVGYQKGGMDWSE